MFWKSVLEGFSILANAEVWVAIIIYMAVMVGFLMIVGLTMGKEESMRGMMMGCLFNMIRGTVIHGILMGLMIAFLLPVLLGGAEAMPVSLVISLFWRIALLGILAIIVVTLLCFIPVVGGFIADSPGMQAFLEGFIIFRVLSGYVIKEIMDGAGVQGNVYPGFWASVGFFIIASVFVKVVVLLISFLTVAIKNETIGEWMVVVLAPAIGVLAGMISLFMYSSWVKLELFQLLGK